MGCPKGEENEEKGCIQRAPLKENRFYGILISRSVMIDATYIEFGFSLHQNQL